MPLRLCIFIAHLRINIPPSPGFGRILFFRLMQKGNPTPALA